MAVESGRRLKVGDSVGVYEVTHIDDRRVRLAVPLGVSLFMLVLGAAALAFDVMLLNAGFRFRVIKIFPKIVQIILVFMPLLAVFSLFMIGQSYDFDAGADRIERRRVFLVAGQYRAGEVGAIVLEVTTPLRSSVVELKLLDRAGKVMLQEFRAELDGTDWPSTLYLAGELARVFGCPVKVEGEVKEAWPNAKNAVEEIRATGMVPEEIRVL